MIITIIAIITVWLAYFLILYGGVAFIQDKRFFSSAHKDILAVLPDKKERFKRAHIVGWIIILLAFLIFAGTLFLLIYDGVKNNFSFLDFFIRFIIVLYATEIYDIVFFDWILLFHSNFFPHFYPEVKGIVGPYMFGYNKKSHLLHFVIYIPVSAFVAWLCSLI